MNTTDQLAEAPTKRHLIYDEFEEFTSKTQGLRSFRIRVWMARDATPIVLISQTEPNFRPSYMTVQIANWVLSAVLRHDERGMLYFDADHEPGSSHWHVDQRFFDCVGHALRQRLTNPSARRKSVEHLEWLVGEPVTF